MGTVHEWLMRGHTPARQAFTPMPLPWHLTWQTALERAGAILASPTYTQGSIAVVSTGDP